MEKHGTLIWQQGVDRVTARGISQQGMILLMVLVLLGIVSALVIAELEAMVLYQKTINKWVFRQANRQYLEKVALDTIASFSKAQQRACTSQAYAHPDQAITLLKTQQACVRTDGGASMYYIIEDIGIVGCLQSVVDATSYSTQHWRITLMSETFPQDYLQIRFATLAEYQPCSNVRVIAPGIVSWRFWSKFNLPEP
jgi:hypothetical protein